MLDEGLDLVHQGLDGAAVDGSVAPVLLPDYRAVDLHDDVAGLPWREALHLGQGVLAPDHAAGEVGLRGVASRAAVLDHNAELFGGVGGHRLDTLWNAISCSHKYKNIINTLFGNM